MPHRFVFPALLFVLALTRVGHFGSVVSLPDASLAVFLLGGLWLGGAGYFAALMALALGIDVYLAQSATEAGWCLTPAYWGLLPTYGVMWLAGRWLSKGAEDTSLLRYAAVSLAATVMAFLISNTTFWAYSGYFGDMTAADYAQAVARYFPSYLGSTALYLALGWAAHRYLRAGRMAAA